MMQASLRSNAFARRERRGFTLVELLVVVAIIALLIAALLPAFGKVRGQAKVTQTVAMFSALNQGIQSFQAEQALGGSIPPSSGDNATSGGKLRWEIADPKVATMTPVKVSGAHLLVHALVGADGLGSPGFRDLNRDGAWWNDTHNAPCLAGSSTAAAAGLYGLDSTSGQPCSVRYGAPGYVDEKMRDHLKSIEDLKKEGKILNAGDVDSDAKLAKTQSLFMDPFDLPVLYYRANKAGISIVSKVATPGVFWQEDNAIITGSSNGLIEEKGLDFGAGKIAGYDGYHEIKDATQPLLGAGSPADLVTLIKGDKSYDHTFARFILDRKVTVKPAAVNSDSYLLISAGPDSRYGTEDDVTNWSRAN